MTDGERDKLHEMNGRLGGVEKALEHFRETWQRQDEEATEGRRRLHDKFDELIRNVAGLNFRVDHLTGEVSALKVEDAHSNNERQQGIGSKKIIALIWSVIVAFIGGTAAIIVEIIHGLWGKH